MTGDGLTARIDAVRRQAASLRERVATESSPAPCAETIETLDLALAALQEAEQELDPSSQAKQDQVQADNREDQGVCLVFDITERKQAQEALGDREAHLQFLVGRIPGFIWTTDIDLRLTLRMGRGLEGIDAQRSDVLGLHIGHFFGTDDADFPPIEAHQRALRGQEASFEQGWEGRIYSAYVEPLRSAAGTITGVIGIAFDITERKQAEEALLTAKAELESRVAERTAALMHANERLQGELSERLHVEAALRESEERFALAVVGANDGIWDWNVRTDEAYFSPRWKSILGYDDHEIGSHIDEWRRLVHPDDAQRLTEGIAAHLRNPEAPHHENEHRLRHKDGSYRWVLSRGLLVCDVRGKPSRMVGSLTDITERKRDEEALRRSEERLALAMAGANDGLWDWDIESNEVYLSPRWKSVLGFGEDELRNHPDEWVERLHPEDAGRVGDTLRAHLKGRTLHFESEYRLRHKDGTYRWVLSRGLAVRDGSGKSCRMAGSITDVTERRQMEEELRDREERFRKVFEEGPIGMALVGPDSRFLRANARLCQLLGYTEKELTARAVADITHPDDVEQTSRLAARLVAGQIPSYQIEKRYLTKDGRVAWVNVTTAIMTDRAGNPLYGLGMVEDITARRQAEREAQRHQAELAHALRVSTLGQMTAGLAHELNQPLAAIVSYARGCTYRMQSGAAPPADLSYGIDQIAAQALRAGEIVQRYRSFLRPDSSRFKQVDANALVRDATSLASSSACEEGVAIRLELAPLMPLIQVDSIQIEQVILNLIRNGCEAMVGCRHRELWVRTTIGTGMIEVAVEDAGNGIPEAVQDRLFEPFVTTKPHGLGMGLSISRSIIEAHGGRLWASPNPGRGTTFRFALPVSGGGPGHHPS